MGFLASFFTSLMALSSTSIQVPTDSCASVLCLGLGLYPNGTAKDSLIRRCDKVLEIVRDLTGTGIPCKLILSGGDAVGCNISEARAMFQYISSKVHVHNSLLIPGINGPMQGFSCSTDHGRCTIVLEEKSKNTIENFLFSSACLPPITGKDFPLYIVSSDYHMPRASLLAKSILKSEWHNRFKMISTVSRQWQNSVTITDCQLSSHSGSKSCILEKSMYRTIKERPIDTEEWYLSEILDWETAGIQRLNAVLLKYGLPLVPSPSIDEALQSVRTLKQSYFDSKANEGI